MWRDGNLTFGEVLGDALNDLFRWDSRFWRTLIPLLFRPGFLTAEFIAGRRARYVPPLRLYLIISFILFLVLSLTAGDALEIEFDGEDPPAAQEAGESADPNAPVVPVELAPGTPQRENAQGERETVFAPIRIGGKGERTALQQELEAELQDEVGQEFSQGFDLSLDPNDPGLPPWLSPVARRLEDNARRLRDDPDLFLDRFLDYLPQIMFVMLPLFALILLLCYALSPFHYLQHLVFGLHYHSFVYLLYLLSDALQFTTSHADLLLVLALLAYLPLALRGAYGSSLPGAIAKSLLIYLLYVILLLIGFAAVSVLVVALL